MNEGYSLSPEGENLIKQFESCMKRAGHDAFKAYVCPAGVLTIGWGHTNSAGGRRFDANAVWTQAECDASFLEDMVPVEAHVRAMVRVQLSQHQFDALVSFVYNCGEGNFAHSTLLTRLNRGDYQGASREFAKWNRGGGRVLAGLVRRRAAEAMLFNEIDHAHVAGTLTGMSDDEAMPQGVDAPKPTRSFLGRPAVLGATGIGSMGASEAISGINDALDQIQSVKEKVSGLGATELFAHYAASPGVLLALALVVAAAFILYDRYELHREHDA
jgi:lysozyme